MDQSKELCGIDETESSLTIPITGYVETALLKRIKNDPVRSEVVVYYKNVRITGTTVQHKVVKSRIRILKIVRTGIPRRPVLFLPFTRKESIEYSAALPQDLAAVELMIYRQVLFEEDMNGIHIRIATETHNDIKHGTSKHFTAEIEYAKHAKEQYYIIHTIETILINKIMSMFGIVLININNEAIFYSCDINDMVTIPSRVWAKFSEHTKFTKNDEELKSFKFDGYKVHVSNNGSSVLYYDCLEYASIIETDWFRFAKCIIFQAEMMQDSKSFIIVDMIGAYIYNGGHKELFMPEPLDVLKFFDFMNNKEIIKKRIHIPGRGSYNLKTQRSIKTIDDQCDEFKDGVIVTLADNIFKYKICTIDTYMIDGMLYLEGLASSISDVVYTGYEDGVYEITPKKGVAITNTITKFTILRRRYDRPYVATVKEFESFVKYAKFMRKFMTGDKKK